MNATVSATTTISELLAQYPAALDVLLAASPAFHKLKNPVLRKLLARRVTIEEAAAMGGVHVDRLLAAIGTACHFAVSPTDSPTLQPSTSTMMDTAVHTPNDTAPATHPWPASHKLVTLDVRPDLAEGRDPFTTIMKTVKRMAKDEVLHLINSFEPVPLYAVLGERKLAHYTEHLGEEWHVYFYNADAVKPSEQLVASNGDMTTLEDGIIELDVSGLEPPEPMQRILVALGSLPDGGTLQVAHHREPLLLYDQLERRGFRWVTTKLGENHYQIQITRGQS